MSPDLLFWLALVVKMAVTAGFVIAATMAAQRVGPLPGALIATLPIAAAPAYMFLAMDHDSAFIAQSALASLAINPVTATFALIYAVLGQRQSLFLSLPAALIFWVILAIVVDSIHWNLIGAVAFNVIVFPLCLIVAQQYRHAPMGPVRFRWRDILARGLMVALLVAAVVALSFKIGAFASGMFAVFPIVLSSIIFILHRRVGGPATAAVLANAITGLIGLGVAFAVLHVAAVPLGSALAMTIALAISIFWGLAVYAMRRVGAPV
ncbi:MAG: hypothetical protein JWN71_3717 [Xanthobacteraceae bacterium]|nr:hypothetical protein [Xanthobacteraceae bacterium]